MSNLRFPSPLAFAATLALLTAIRPNAARTQQAASLKDSVPAITTAYQYSQKEEKIDSLRGDAVRDAMRKANSYVKAIGIRLGRVLEIASQPHAPVPVGMAPRMRAAAAPAHEAALVVPVEPRDFTDRGPSHLGARRGLADHFRLAF